MKHQKIQIKSNCLAILALSLLPLTAMANGQFENRSWQFDTASQKSVKAGILDLEEKKKGGFYDGFSTTVNTTFTTNIFGDQINCDLQASALGNTGTNVLDSLAGSPVGSNDAFDTNSQGNTSDTIASLGDTGQPGVGEVINNQTSTDSPVSSSIDNSGVNLEFGEQVSNGTNNLDVATNQSNEGARLDASILNSTACSNPGTGS